MAKRGTLDHPKTLALSSLLDIDQAHALGLLEALWHFAGTYAPQGDIGRFSNSAIAQGMRTRINPETLIEALVNAHYLDKCGEKLGRLVIHDWSDHADEAVRKKLQRVNLGFKSVETPSRRRRDVGRQKADSVPTHARGPEPEPEPSQSLALTRAGASRRARELAASTNGHPPGGGSSDFLISSSSGPEPEGLRAKIDKLKSHAAALSDEDLDERLKQEIPDRDELTVLTNERARRKGLDKGPPDMPEPDPNLREKQRELEQRKGKVRRRKSEFQTVGAGLGSMIAELKSKLEGAPE
jgi:hypothetical protein